jgi:hypothetical protein
MLTQKSLKKWEIKYNCWYVVYIENYQIRQINLKQLHYYMLDKYIVLEMRKILRSSFRKISELSN